MTKRVQIIGHEADLANQFVGLERELTADISNQEIRLHDGGTPGGTRILGRDANDNRYQRRSVELDGLLGWEPNERGFPVRLGPSTYRLRSITVNGSQLTIANANGYEGNPNIGLAGTITTDHTWSGAVTFEQAIAADGGVVGNLTGDSTGLHTGDVVGDVTGDLLGNAVGNHSGTFAGDVDVRGHTLQLSGGQIEFGWLSNAILDYIVGKGLPVGSVIAYAGPPEDIPSNWFLCDGTNGTPDLRNRFIVAAGATYPAYTSGGAATHTHAVTIDSGGAHSHTGVADDMALTVGQMPAHSHGNGVVDNNVDNIMCYGMKASPAGGDVDSLSHPHNTQGITETIGGGGTHGHSLTVDAGGAHTHTGNTAAASSLPPYYSLMYIMKGS